jgi:muramidase (phage lysozyme)
VAKGTTTVIAAVFPLLIRSKQSLLTLRIIFAMFIFCLSSSGASATPLAGSVPSFLKQPLSGIHEGLIWEHMGPIHADDLKDQAEYKAKNPDPDHFDALLALPQVKAALATIRYAEGADYDRLFGYFTDNSRVFDHMVQVGHPRSIFRAPGGYISSAAGAYQALPSTWDEEVKKGSMKDRFTPYEQDRFALGRLQYRGLLDEVVAGNTWWINSKAMGREWASFPSSPYGQPQKSRPRLERYYRSQLNHQNIQN